MTLATCQVLDLPQQLPAEAVEARQQLNNLLQLPSGAPAPSSHPDQVMSVHTMLHIVSMRSSS